MIEFGNLNTQIRTQHTHTPVHQEANTHARKQSAIDDEGGQTDLLDSSQKMGELTGNGASFWSNTLKSMVLQMQITLMKAVFNCIGSFFDLWWFTVLVFL